MAIRFARSARRHGIARARIVYVIEHCGLRLEQPAPAESTKSRDVRLVYLGDDANGVPLEVMAVEQEDGDLLVIHAMRLRRRFEAFYAEVAKWQK